MNNPLIERDSVEISTNISSFSVGLSNYLQYLHLPIDSVLVPIKEKERVIAILPHVIEDIDIKKRERAYYLSKFVAACSVGLFDSALNYLWNETILNLREKVIAFDLDFFFDNAISDSNKRSKFTEAKDLVGLGDRDFIDACKKTGLISDIGYLHLIHINDMRNHASAAHPNNVNLTALDLLDWLEKCLKEVLSKEPTGAILEIRRLIHNLKTISITPTDAREFIASIKNAPKELIHSFLTYLFGIYTDSKIQASVKLNIKLLAKDIWGLSSEGKKYEIGKKYGNFALNCDIDRKKLAYEFLELVDGLSYLSDDQRILNIQDSIDSLYAAHLEFNNFYTEESHVKTVIKFIGEQSFPIQIIDDLVKVIMICKLGNNYGVAYSAEPYYNSIINRFQDEEILVFIKLLSVDEFKPLLQIENKVQKYQKIAEQLLKQTNNEIFKEALNVIINSNITDLKNPDILINRLRGLVKFD